MSSQKRQWFITTELPLLSIWCTWESGTVLLQLSTGLQKEKHGVSPVWSWTRSNCFSLNCSSLHHMNWLYAYLCRYCSQMLIVVASINTEISTWDSLYELLNIRYKMRLMGKRNQADLLVDSKQKCP